MHSVMGVYVQSFVSDWILFLVVVSLGVAIVQWVVMQLLKTGQDLYIHTVSIIFYLTFPT